MPRFHLCNVLQLSSGARRLWQFSIGQKQARLEEESARRPDEPLPKRLAAKDWHNLFKPKLNLAWLPADQVFLRVVHLPVCDYSEVVSMVELQLEKLSPLPVAHMVWSVEQIGRPTEELQAVVVIIVARSVVEEFLGRLEEQGYLADRLELPLLHQLRATEVDADGAWIFPSPDPNVPLCLVAWWYGGMLQHLSLLHCPPTDHGRQMLEDELAKTAWAGEIEGWLTAPPAWRLVANDETAAVWRPVLEQALGETLQGVSPHPDPDLAAMNARWLAEEQPRANLLPNEYSVRYRQQYVDRLWMRGLAALVILYLVYVAGHLGWTQVRRFQLHQVESEIAGREEQYTDAKRLKARMRILQDQVNLKFAALDCWKTAVELLPPELELRNLNFRGGQSFELRGIGTQTQIGKVTDYNEALSEARVNGDLLFTQVRDMGSRIRQGEMGPQTVHWHFECELKQDQVE